VNHGPHQLHGGVTGFDKMVWAPKTIEKPDFVGVELKYRSVHLEEGFPGNLDVTILYKVTHKNDLQIEYKAVTDKPTVVNLTNHTYFNLTSCKEDIRNHHLQVNGKKRTVTTPDLIPTGEIAEVAGTPFDFTKGEYLGTRIGELPDGYDLNYVLDNTEHKMVCAGILKEEKSGRKITVYTTEPALQLYTGYYIPAITNSAGQTFGKYMGVALETQHYADSPNHPGFPSTTLRPGETYQSKTTFHFETKKPEIRN
jgi:aldose 1-epimerase